MKPAMWVELPFGSGISATPYISQTTAKIIQKEFRRAHKSLKQVESGRGHWSDVYGTARFFQRHDHYLQFDFSASSEAVLARWLAWGRQQMQGLVQLFELMNHQKVTLRPWPEWISFKDAEWPCAKAVFVGLHLKRGEMPQEGERRSYDLREPIVKLLEAINAWPDADRFANQFELVIRHVRLAEVEQWLDFCRKGLVANAHLNKSKDPALQAWPQGQ
jgi:poly(A) polymerase Pap1